VIDVGVGEGVDTAVGFGVFVGVGEGVDTAVDVGVVVVIGVAVGVGVGVVFTVTETELETGEVIGGEALSVTWQVTECKPCAAV